MAYLVALDDGHGLAPTPTPGKRTQSIPGVGVIYENEFNKAVVNELKKELNRHGVNTLLVAPTDHDTPLSTRVSVANRSGAHLYISVHYNAGGGSGVETFHYPTSTKGRKLAQLVHKHVKGGTPQKDRGVKTAHFYVLKNTKMPAALIEYGFMDDPGLIEARRMKDPNFIKECAVETCKGILEYLGIPYKSLIAPPTIPAKNDKTTKKFYDVSINEDENPILSSQVITTLTNFLVDQLRKDVDSITFVKRK